MERKPYEKILFMSDPGAGKTTQMISIARMYPDKPFYVIDMEYKLFPYLCACTDGWPDNLHLYETADWDREPSKGDDGGVVQIIKKLDSKIQPGDWLAIDRADALWPAVQNWFTENKYKKGLSEKLLESSKKMNHGSKFTPSMDQGEWQVINSEYEKVMHKILYRWRCNIVFTTSVKDKGESTIGDAFGNLQVAPRGQKEIGHQAISVFYLSQSRLGSAIQWLITTGKDLPNREYYERYDITKSDFGIEYLGVYGA